MSDLRDALASALNQARFNYNEADAVLADPAFRAALTDAIAKALTDVYAFAPTHDIAADIVAGMMGEADR